MTMRKIGSQTPLGQLLAEKRELRFQCQETEGKIKNNLHYIRSNAGRLLFSGMTAIFTPRRKEREEQMGGGGLVPHPWMHMLWQIVRPIAYRWMGEVGWQVFKSMFRKRR